MAKISANLNYKTMRVNGFEIDTYEGAKGYLQSQGVDVSKMETTGLTVINGILQNQALNLAGVSNLLPCPFCGSEAKTLKVGETYSTMCDNGDCNVCPEAEGQTRVESILNWNKRQ